MMGPRGRCRKFRGGWEETGDWSPNFVLRWSDDLPQCPESQAPTVSETGGGFGFHRGGGGEQPEGGCFLTGVGRGGLCFLTRVLTLENSLLFIHPFQKLFTFSELLIFGHRIPGSEKRFRLLRRSTFLAVPELEQIASQAALADLQSQ